MESAKSVLDKLPQAPRLSGTLGYADDPKAMPSTAPAVLKAIGEVSRELALLGVGKDQENKQQGFKFRGVDDVYNVLAALLPKHGLVILPRVLNRAVTERQSSKGTALFSVICEIEYTLASIIDGSERVVRFIGEGMDSGDKATNKAMAIAYKYMAFQTFCIPVRDGQDDPDKDAHAVKATRPSGMEHQALRDEIASAAAQLETYTGQIAEEHVKAASKFTTDGKVVDGKVIEKPRTLSFSDPHDPSVKSERWLKGTLAKLLGELAKLEPGAKEGAELLK